MSSALRVVEDNMDKQKALEAAMSQIERAHGKGALMKLGQVAILELTANSRTAKLVELSEYS